ncbi:MAG: peptidase S16 [Candidatus Latescibacteria bacterium]|nr:peptidase S16 [Candidatus Latescibacterota bacterium]
MNQSIIPLFPLPLVVFPGERRPLHIFEERYKTMIAHCRDAADGPLFGIALVKDNKLYGAGCGLELIKILHTYPDGRLDIIAVGRRRFRILEVYSDRQPYLQAKVEFIEDEALPVDEDLVQQALEKRQTLDGLSQDSDPIEHLEETPSFALVQGDEFGVEDKQRVLEMTDENERLRALIECFDRLIPVLRQHHQERERARGQTGKIESNGHL